MLSALFHWKNTSLSELNSTISATRLISRPMLFAQPATAGEERSVLRSRWKVDDVILVLPARPPACRVLLTLVELVRVRLVDDQELLVHLERDRLPLEDVDRHRHDVVAVAAGVEPRGRDDGPAGADRLDAVEAGALADDRRVA